jgi:NAD-dependent DNA ligase
LRDYTICELKEMSRHQLSFIPEIGTETSEKLYTALKAQTETLDELFATLNVQNSKPNNTPKELICFDFVTSKLSKPMKFYMDLLKKHNYNRVKPVTLNSKLLLPQNLKALVTTKDKESKSRIIFETRTIGAGIFTPEEWVNSLPEITNENIVEGKTICFTGKMPKKRSYYEKIASQNKYTPVDKVNKGLNTLVVADLSSTSSKAQKAHKLGVSVVSLDEWLKERVLTKEAPQEEEGLLPGFQ